MPIRVVDAKQALEDIRSGMDDNALMQKYRISSLHLEQLFGKLESLNVLKRLPARGLLKDMRAGLNDANLMAKYHLSAAALQNVFSEMIRNGLILQSSELSPVREKKRISAKEIVGDIRAGMTAHQLMKKYELSAKGLRRVFHKLLAAGWVAEDEFSAIPADEDITVILQKMRKATRRHPVLSVALYEKGKPHVTGLLRDLSATGLGVIRYPREGRGDEDPRAGTKRFPPFCSFYGSCHVPMVQRGQSRFALHRGFRDHSCGAEQLGGSAGPHRRGDAHIRGVACEN